MIKLLRHRTIGYSGLVLAALAAAICMLEAGSLPDTGTTLEEATAAGTNPIMFVTQVPVSGYTTLSSAFGNHLSTLTQAPRGEISTSDIRTERSVTSSRRPGSA